MERPGLNDTGSSPLARGTLQVEGLELALERFIPAGAGNTAPTDDATGQFPVHPRWRGEHTKDGYECRQTDGSSPLARGTLDCCGRAIRQSRFIPAGAGNTHTTSTWRAMGSVHPRWRGEHQFNVSDVYCNSGSSPLARGTLGDAPPRPVQKRFIPAGAGNTSVPGWNKPPRTVHPRWRGEHLRPASSAAASAGSSPLARGTLLA